MTNLELSPYLVLILVGFLPNEIWRALGLVVARGLNEDFGNRRLVARSGDRNSRGGHCQADPLSQRHT